MLRVEFHAEDLHVVAERDIKEQGQWSTNVSDTFDNKFQVVQLTDTSLGYLLLLIAAGDDELVVQSIPKPVKEFLDGLFTEVRPYP